MNYCRDYKHVWEDRIKVNKKIYELKLFFKNNMVVLFFFMFSLIVVIKNSEIPLLSNIPAMIKWVFTKPDAGTITAFVFIILENISLAYIASCVFYFVVDYFPKRKNEKKAYLLIKDELRDIYGELSYIIRMFLFEIKVDEEPREIIKDRISLSKVCNIHLENKDTHAKIAHYYNGSSNSSSYSYNICNDTVRKTINIEQKIESIYDRPRSKEIETSLYEVIDGIRGSRFLRMIKNYGQGGYVEAPSRNRIFLNLDKSFRELVSWYVKLGKYDFDKIDYKIFSITETEWKKQNEELVLMLDRSCFLNIPIDKLRGKVNCILKIELNDENFDRITGVLCELLVACDFSPSKKGDLLPMGKHIAGYLKRHEGKDERSAIAAINYLQILRRMGTATKKDVREVKWIITSRESMPKYIVLGALILVKNYKEAEKLFDSLSTEMKQFFISLPIYRLWPSPPMSPNIEPRDFRKL